MDFDLSEEQRLMRESAAKFATQQSGMQGWQALGEAGFLALGLPEDYGGFGGPVEIALVAEEFGRHLLKQPFAGTGIFAGQLMARAGTIAQRDRLLALMATGAILGAVASTDAEGEAVVARRDADGFILSGRKLMVLGGTQADLFIVSAREDGSGRRLFFTVDRDGPGVNVIPTPMVDGSSCADLKLDAVSVGPDALMAADGDAAFDEALRYAMVCVCAEMVGMAEAATAASIDYLKNRQQFGTTLSSFQVLRHRIADMAMDCQMARSALHKLLASFEDGLSHDPAMATALAKAMIEEIGVRVTSEAIQLHGAMGMTEECGVGQFYRRAILIQSLFGSAMTHLEHYSAALAERVSAV